jgi:hypothetical protein
VAEVVNTRHADRKWYSFPMFLYFSDRALECAKRWQQSLDPNLSHAKWKESDHQKLLDAVQVYGRKWKQISSELFPGRSTTDLKNR